MIINSKLKKQIEIINNYVDKNGCLPSESKAVILGIDIGYINSVFKTYENFVSQLGFESLEHHNLKTYVLVDATRNDMVICTATLKFIYENYFDDLNYDYIRSSLYKNKLIKKQYKIYKGDQFDGRK